MVTPRTISRSARISCSPSTMKTAVPALNALTRAMERSYQRGKGYAQHDDQRWEQSTVLTFPVTFRNTHKCDQHQCT